MQIIFLLLAFFQGALGEWGEWVPETPLWRARQEYRLEQIKRVENSQEQWDGLMNVAMSNMVPNFTDVGYAIVPTPAHVHKRLNETLHKALGQDNRVRSEGRVDQISGPVANFVDIGRLKNEVMSDLKPLLEAWSGVPLLSSNAYGLRLYGQGNTLTMHTDRIETHVVSCIVHVDRDVDEPYPIAIEGFDGKTVEVDIQPGEILFYESAKCIHGRPRPLNGRWYTSLFVHYRPVGWKMKTEDARKVAESFLQNPDLMKVDPSDRRTFNTLRLRGTGFYEPDCPNNWCDLPPTFSTPQNHDEF